MEIKLNMAIAETLPKDICRIEYVNTIGRQTAPILIVGESFMTPEDEEAYYFVWINATGKYNAETDSFDFPIEVNVIPKMPLTISRITNTITKRKLQIPRSMIFRGV